MKTRAQYIEGL